MTSLGTLDLNFLTLRRLFPYRNATTDICANTILLQNARGEPVWIDPADVFGDVSGTLVAKGNCDSDYLYWDQGSQLWLAGGKRVHIGCEAGVVQPDVSGTAVAIGYNAGYRQQASTSVAIGQYAGYSTQGAGAVAMGSYAGYWNQRANGVAIGTNAGVSTQGTGSIAIGASAGAVRQDISAVAIGFNAGFSTQCAGSVALGSYAGFMDQSGSAVAMGLYAGNAEQGFGAVAVGAGAGNACQTSNAVAVGYYAGSGNQGTNAVAVGVNAGASLQGVGAVAIGSLAGSVGQGAIAIAIGSNAGGITQGVGAVAIGYLAGSNAQLEGAVAIGSNAGYDRQGLRAVAMGLGAGYSTQGTGAIAIGSNAGYSSQGAGAVAMGMAAGFSTQGANAVAIGSNAGFGLQSAGAIAMGAGAGYSTQGAGAVAIGSNAGYSTQGTNAVALGLSAGWSSQGVGAVAVGFGAGLSTQGTGAVAIGSNAGVVDQSANAIAIGLSAGFSTQGTSAVAIGWTAGSNVQGIGAIAVGEGAGLTRQGTNAVAVGLGAGLSTQNANAIAIGSNAGYSTQGLHAIAFGTASGISSQGANAIAIGSNAGAIVQGIGAVAMGESAGLRTQGPGTVAIGSNAGVFDQSGGAIAMGFGAGYTTQGIKSVAIGSNAGYTSQGTHAVAIGTGAGITSQGVDAIAIGSNAGAVGQGRGGIAIGAIPVTHIQRAGAIAIGSNAITTTQDASAIAIGLNVCGGNIQRTSAIAIGYNAVGGGEQRANTIVLNANGSAINTTQPSALYIDPIRDDTGDVTDTYLVQYLTGQKEVVYNNNVSINSFGGRINVSGDILPTADIRYSLGSSALAFKHLYVSSIISDTSNVAVSGDIVPYVDNLYSLGLSTLRWKDVFVGPGSVYIGGATNATRAILEASDNSLVINRTNGGSVGIGIGAPTARLHVQGTTLLNDTVTAGGNIIPNANGIRDLGTTSVRWNNIYTNFIDVSAGFTFTGNLEPSTDNTYTLGSIAKRWRDLYIGTGAVYIGGTTSPTRAELTSATNNLIINATNGGNVGIGNASPSVALDVSGSGRFTSLITSINTDATQYSNSIALLKSRNGAASNSGDELGYIQASGYTGSAYERAGYIIFVQDGAVSGGRVPGAIVFHTTNTVTTGTERMRITTAGNVGIGTNTPTQALDVSGIVKANNMYINADTSGTQSGLYFNVANNAQFVLLRPANTTDLTFLNNNTGFAGYYQLTLKSNRNVGIGSSNPTVPLDVSGSIKVTNGFVDVVSTTDPAIAFTTNTSVRGSIYMNTATNRLTFDTTGYLYPIELQGSSVLILPTGNVGIGSGIPGEKLDVVGNIRANGGVLYAQFNDGAYNPQIKAGGTGATINRYTYIGYNTTNNHGFIGAVEFGVLARDLLIQPFGANVGIGTTTPPAYKLDVVGDTNISSGSVYRINTRSVLTANNWIFASASVRYDGPFPPYYAVEKSYNINTGDFSVIGGGDISFNFLNLYNPLIAPTSPINYVVVASSHDANIIVSAVVRNNGYLEIWCKSPALTYTATNFSFIVIYNG